MSSFDMEQSGQIDTVGSRPYWKATESAELLGHLDPEEMPESPSVLVQGGVDQLARLVHGFRMALTWQQRLQPVHYWTERDLFAQSVRLGDRRQWANKNGHEDMVTEFEVNRMNFEEFKASAILVFDGFGSTTGRYGFGQIEMVTDILYERATQRDLHTIVVTCSELPPTDFELFAHYREKVSGMYESVYL